MAQRVVVGGCRDRCGRLGSSNDGVARWSDGALHEWLHGWWFWVLDDVKNNERTNYFNSPALDVSVAFPQATPASTCPPCTSDYYQIDDLLTPEEQAIRLRVRECMEKDVAPIMAEYWEKAEFPFQIIPKLGALRIAGGTIKGYGCPGLSITANAFATAEIARVDASCSTFFLVHSSAAMLTIALCGSEAQKQKYLPSLAEFKTVACWGLTEPDYGSDASALRATATKEVGYLKAKSDG
ncbi:hypothetical protein ACFX2H_009810 [Malus domestica]